MNANGLLKEGDVKAMRRPMDQASTPPAAYYSKEMFDVEIERIFFKEWLYAGHVEQVQKPGNYIAFDLVGEPIIVARNRSGQLSAFSAVCRHRGALVVAPGQGNCNAFHCPYHLWTYSLTGSLIGTPQWADSAKGFDRSQFGLRPLKVETWGGMFFVNFDPNSKSLLSHLGDLPERLKDYKLEEMVCVDSYKYTYPCNWKQLGENTLDAYHIVGTHRKSLPDLALGGTTIDPHPNGAYEILETPEVAPPTYPVIESLTTDAQKKNEYFIYIYPNFMLWLTPDSYMCFTMDPDGPDRTSTIHDKYLPRKSAQRSDLEETRKQVWEFLDVINKEDISTMGWMSAGLRSRLFVPGRFHSIYEEVPYKLTQYVLDRVLD